MILLFNPRLFQAELYFENYERNLFPQNRYQHFQSLMVFFHTFVVVLVLESLKPDLELGSSGVECFTRGPAASFFHSELLSFLTGAEGLEITKDKL